jgi:hypothetical protein
LRVFAEVVLHLDTKRESDKAVRVVVVADTAPGAGRCTVVVRSLAEHILAAAVVLIGILRNGSVV